MEPLYTAETRNQIERVLSVFRDYIVTTNYFDILYSKKVGYVYFDINPKRMKVAENNCFVIENGEQLARRLAYDMAAGRKILCKRFSTKSRMALESRADSGLNPLITESHGGQNGMRAGTA